MNRFSATEPPRLYATFRYRNAAEMVDWLAKAFGFQVHAKHMDGGNLAHAELALGSSIIMLGEARDDAFGGMVGEPGEHGGKAIYIAVDDPDALFEQAQAVGAKILQGLTERDYGSREFICADPQGNVWCFGTYWPKAQDAAG